MIPVAARKAPKGFNEKVYRPGVQWLKSKGLPLSGKKPQGVELEPFWREILPQLHDAYGGVCAYLCIYFEKALGSHTVDHFIGKSNDIGEAYRWRNYRLACQRMNQRKGTSEDLLDPFTIAPNTFCLNVWDGSISPDPHLDQTLKIRAQTTIDRLGLDDADCRRTRVNAFNEYIGVNSAGPIPFAHLKKRHPFVAYEVERQNLRRPND